MLDDKNRNPDSTHLIHKILPVRHLQNYKDTPLSSFFSSPAVGTDQNILIPRCNLPIKHHLQNSPPLISWYPFYLDLFERVAGLEFNFSQKKSHIRSFRMYDIPEFIYFSHQIVVRPYLPPSTTFRCSLSNDVLLPLAQKKPRIVKPRTSIDQKNTILQFFKPSKKPRVLRTSPS